MQGVGLTRYVEREKRWGCVCIYWIINALSTAIRLIKLAPENRYIENDLLADMRARFASGKVVGKVNLPRFNH